MTISSDTSFGGGHHRNLLVTSSSSLRQPMSQKTALSRELDAQV